MPVLRYVCIILVLMVLADTARAAGTPTTFMLEIYDSPSGSDLYGIVTAGATFTVRAYVADDSGVFAGDNSAYLGQQVCKYLTGTTTASKALYGTTIPIISLPCFATFSTGVAWIPGFVLFNASETPTITVHGTDSMAGTFSSITVNAGLPSRFNVMIKDNGTKTAGVGFGVNLEITDAYGNPTGNPNNAATQTLSISYSWNAATSSNGSLPIPQVGLSSNITFINGTASFGTFTPVNAEDKPCIVVSYEKDYSIYGTSSPIAIQASSPSNLRFFPPATVTAGADFSLGTITVCDRFGNTVTTFSTSTSVSYNGTTSQVFFNNGISSDPLYTKLIQTGTITMTIGTITGTSNLITVISGSPTSMAVTTENHGTETAGIPFSVILTLNDDYGSVPDYTGSRSISWSWTAGTSSNNGTPTKPEDRLVTFTHGVGTITGFMLTNAGESPSITANGTISGTISGIVVKPGTPTSFTITAPGTETAGASFTLTITAFDAFGNIADYQGSKTLTYSGYGTSSPSEVNFASGTVSFEVQLVKAEETMITVKEGDIIGTSGKIVVVPASPVRFILSTEHQGTETAGTPFAITIKASGDTFGNDTSNYTGPHTLFWDGNALKSYLDKPYQWADAIQIFDHGIATATGFTLTNATQTVIWVSEGITSGTTTPITVIPAGVSYLDIKLPSPVTVNQPFSINSLIARDDWGNVAVSYSDTKTIIFSGPRMDATGNKPSYPPAVVFDAGVAILPLTIILKVSETVGISLSEGNIHGSFNNLKVVDLKATCTVLPHIAYANAAQTINYKITNAGDSAISQIRITIPTGFTYINVGTPATNNQSWTATGSNIGQFVLLTPNSVGDYLSPGAWLTVPITVRTKANEQLPVKWQSVITNNDGRMAWVQEENEGDSEVAIAAYTLKVATDTITVLPGGTATIKVRVVYPQTETPISGAIVSGVIGSQTVGTASTNDKGYAVLNIPAGTTTTEIFVKVICGLFNIGTISFQVVSPIPTIIVGTNSFSKDGVIYAKPSTIFEMKPFGNLKQEYKMDNGSWGTFSPPFYINSPGKHQIFCRYVDESGKAGTESSFSVFIAPEPYKLRNFPNPFNPLKEETSIEYPLTSEADVDIQIYNLFGQLVWRKEILAGQEWEHKWNGRNGDGEIVGNGGYICRVTIKYPSGDVVMVRRIGVVK